MPMWDCGRDQQEEQTLNSKCKVIKLLTPVKCYSVVKFFNNKGNHKIHQVAPLEGNFNGMKLGYAMSRQMFYGYKLFNAPNSYFF